MDQHTGTEISGKDLNIIGDCNGRMRTLEALVAKMPRGAVPFSVGDMGDRTRRAREVIQFFKDLGGAIRGNHEDMMLSVLCGWDRYSLNMWINNGGWATLDSYNPNMQSLFDLQEERLKDAMRMAEETLPGASVGQHMRWIHDNVTLLYESDIRARFEGVDKDHIEWLRSLPLWYQDDGLLITHAPIEDHYDLSNRNQQDMPERFLWHRGLPERIEGFVNVFGHNHNFLNAERLKYDCGEDAKCFPLFGTDKRGKKYDGPTKFMDEKDGLWAICLDTDYQGHLTGMHWPSMELYHQEFLEE